MPVPQWEAGKLYQPGAVVRPVSASGILANAIANPGFEAGDTGWTKEDWVIEEASPAFEGTWRARYAPANPGDVATLMSDSHISATPGQQCSFHLYTRAVLGDRDAGCRPVLRFYDSGDTLLRQELGGFVRGDKAGSWRKTKMPDIASGGVGNGIAPSGTSYFRVGVAADREIDSTQATEWLVDKFVLTSVHRAANSGLVFTAVQADSGFSAANEPDWPDTTGLQVVDNDVTWEAIAGTRVVWSANPILVSGSVEPTWPVGGAVPDNTIAWEFDPRRVDDENAPNSKVVALAASKIFAGDDDIVPFSATVAPMDWTTVEDAGYLPFGLQSYGSEPVEAIGLYRSNLVIFNSKGFQMWQVDEDPQNMALLDAEPIGCRWHRSVQPVSNDLVFLSQQGFRSIGIAGASTNLQSGDFGKQIDPLVLPKIAVLSGDDEPIALFVPGLGQYWCFFEGEAFVLTHNGTGKAAMSWSRYTFPDAVTDWTIQDGDLYLRTGDLVWRVDPDVLVDDFDEGNGAGGANIEYTGYVAWPYLEFGSVGDDKSMVGFKLVVKGEVDVQFGYNQADDTQVTPSYVLTGDTVPGDVIPMPITAPSFQMRLTFSGNQAWEWNASVLYVNDNRISS